MIALLRAIAGGAAALFVQCWDADAENLIAVVEPSEVAIGSSYSGSSIVVFGAIEGTRSPTTTYDVVVTVNGPRQNVVARRKEQVVGVWINAESRTFKDIPSFLAVFASRPFDQIASADVLRRQRVGLLNSIFVDRVADANDPYLAGLIQIRSEDHVYNEQPRGVRFVSPAVFRAEIPLPKSVLIGAYDVELEVFTKGELVTQVKTVFKVVKIGVEEFVVKSSIDDSLLYGLTTMCMGLLTGWIASIAFRRS